MSEGKRTLDVGRVISDSFSIWLKLLIPLLLMGIVVFLPLIGYTVHVAFNDLSQEALETLVWVEMAGAIILGFLLVGAVTYLVVEHIAGRRRSVGVGLAMGLRNLPGVLGTSLVGGIAVIGGLLLLVVPGVIVACMIWVAVPVVVLEQRGGLEALKRSRELTTGLLGPVFGVLFTFGFLEWVVNKVLEVALLGDPTPASLQAFLMISLFASIALSTLSSVAAAVGYVQLRHGVDGVSAGDLAAVFD